MILFILTRVDEQNRVLMWMIENQTSYAAERTWVRDKNGVHHWIVVIKATFDIVNNGIPKLAKEQLKPLYAPEYHGRDGESSLRFDTDLGAMKPGTDIVLNGTAYPNNRSQTNAVVVTAKIGNMSKSLLVHGDRVWERSIGGITPSRAEPFKSMPITYERAFGGYDNHRLDSRNPVGTGFCSSTSELIGASAPNIEYPNQKLGKGPPAGFGAIASHWSPRLELQGTYDEKWMKERSPLLPLDYNPQSLFCSPVDQRVQGYLRGGEVIELVHLSSHGILRFALPVVELTCETFFGHESYVKPAQLVTVVMEPDDLRLVMVWSMDLECRNNGDYLDYTVIRTGS